MLCLGAALVLGMALSGAARAAEMEKAWYESIFPIGDPVHVEALTGKGPYKAEIKLISQPAPVNLLVAMQDVGFDYGLTPRQAGDALVAGAQVLWERKLTFDVE